MRVMMMVMMTRGCFELNAAVFFAAMLIFGLELESCMADAVLAKLLAHACLYFAVIGIRNNVHRCVFILTVDRPYMNMMNAEHALDLADMGYYFGYIGIGRGFFEEDIYCFFKVFKGIYKNKYRNADRHYRV